MITAILSRTLVIIHERMIAAASDSPQTVKALPAQLQIAFAHIHLTASCLYSTPHLRQGVNPTFIRLGQLRADAERARTCSSMVQFRSVSKTALPATSVTIRSIHVIQMPLTLQFCHLHWRHKCLGHTIRKNLLLSVDICQ